MFGFGFIASPQPEEVRWWGQVCIEEGMDQAALLLNLKMTQVRSDADKLLRGSARDAQSMQQVLQVLEHARDLLQELDQWVTSAAEHDVATSNGDPDGGRDTEAWAACSTEKACVMAAFPGHRVLTFANLWVARKHMNSNASRVMLGGIVTRCLSWMCAPADASQTAE